MATWIAGFDVLYALDDRASTEKPASIPYQLAWRAASLAAFRCTSRGQRRGLAGRRTRRGAGLDLSRRHGRGHRYAGLGARHPAASDLSHLNVAFFNLNGYVSVIYFVATLADVLLKQWAQ